MSKYLNLKKIEKSGSQQCQKCLKYGHWTFECKNPSAYLYRPSRTTLFKNPELNIETSYEKPPKITKLRDIDLEQDEEAYLKDNKHGEDIHPDIHKDLALDHSSSPSEESSSSESSKSDESDSDSVSSDSSESSDKSSSNRKKFKKKKKSKLDKFYEKVQNYNKNKPSEKNDEKMLNRKRDLSQKSSSQSKEKNVKKSKKQ